ncbi:GntR family transcriptional regulator [Paraburkholderia phenazinium]|uniref:DNA-binding transcriptional regulator, GntR family n=1 Tax=Paraburkholderia phenazinium TaxID=60549 RepID=A0A1G7VGD3_9BURK|nr:GntR family transcriptional regulator [Paraburkholderia phenazinium]SDG57990.1 DNA-binding transcriptional regulator, GntR family [Paraburkholderia phenazinium]
MPNEGHVVETGTLAEQAHQILEELIVTLALPPGSVWSEASLAERLSIGKTPVREAAQRLEAAHLVEIVPRHGIMITKPNIHEQLLVLETRRELERLIAQRAARRALPNEREQMRAAAAMLEVAGESGDVLAYLRSLYVANQLMGKLARNTFAAEAIAPLHALSRRFYFMYYQQLNDLKTASRLHSEVTNAVAAGDERAAGLAADSMMDYIDSFTKACLTRDFEPLQVPVQV